MAREHKGSSLLKATDTYVCLDLETTGYDPRWDDIIEIGAIKIEHGKPVDTYHTLINPGRKIPLIVTEISGITDDMVKDAPPLTEMLPGFLDWIGEDLLLGHNANFDINFLYDNAEDICGRPVANDYVDTLRLARYLYPEEPHNRLRDLIVRFGIAQEQEHRALADVEQTISCYDYMIRHMEEDSIPFPPYEGRMVNKSGVPSVPILFHRGDTITVNPAAEIHPDPAFQGRTFVFTGALERMVRKDAQQAVLNLGGIVGTGVTKKTNCLVIGSTEYNATLRGKKSSKQIKAETLRAAGQDIDIISENVFYDMLGDIMQ